MQSIILVTYCADLEISDVSSAVDCVQLTLSIRYGLYMLACEEGSGLCVCGLSKGRRRLVALINTCRHGP